MTYRVLNEEKSDEYFSFYDVFDDDHSGIGADQVPTQKWYDENSPPPDADGDGTPDGDDAAPNDPTVQ